MSLVSLLFILSHGVRKNRRFLEQTVENLEMKFLKQQDAVVLLTWSVSSPHEQPSSPGSIPPHIGDLEYISFHSQSLNRAEPMIPPERGQPLIHSPLQSRFPDPDPPPSH